MLLNPARILVTAVLLMLLAGSVAAMAWLQQPPAYAMRGSQEVVAERDDRTPPKAVVQRSQAVRREIESLRGHPWAAQ